jgi:hypothetical protein
MTQSSSTRATWPAPRSEGALRWDAFDRPFRPSFTSSYFFFFGGRRSVPPTPYRPPALPAR